jgi:hypothetical protein
MDVAPKHADPDVVLWSWCQEFLHRDLLPDQRVVVRFEFSFLGRPTKGWMLIEDRDAEICRVDPGFGEDLAVIIADPLMFARWHIGLVDWGPRSGLAGPQLSGPRALCRALPTSSWNWLVVRSRAPSNISVGDGARRGPVQHRHASKR